MAPRRLESVLRRQEVFWVKEWKAVGHKRSAWSTWDGATAGDRAVSASWVRGWAEAERDKIVRAVMKEIDAHLHAAFHDEVVPQIRRWAAAVVLDVLGDEESQEDIALCVELVPRPKFGVKDVFMIQFTKLEAYEDLWSGPESRASELLQFIAPESTIGEFDFDKVHEVLCRWVVATCFAELLHARALETGDTEPRVAVAAWVAVPSAREAMLQKARSLRGDIDDEESENDFDDDEDAAPKRATAAVVAATAATEPASTPKVVLPPTAVPSKGLPSPGVPSPGLPKALPSALPPPPPAGGRPKTAVGAYYASSQGTSRDANARHAAGYDALDAATENLRLDEGDASQKRAKLRQLLVEHVAAMSSRGLVFEASFAEASLGFTVCLSRYGELGRKFVMVESTAPNCQHYGKIKPGDELVSVNGAYIIDADEAAVATLLRFVADAPRPLLAKFVAGEEREKLAAKQPTQTPTYKLPRSASEAALSSPPDDALVVAFDRVGDYAGYVGSDGKVRTSRRRVLGFVHRESWACFDSKENFLGRCDGDGDVVAIRDVHDETVGYVDLGRARVLDASRSTLLEISRTGDCLGHNSMSIGRFEKFTYAQTRLAALVYIFVAPNIFELKVETLARRIRKSSASLTGARGFFS